MSRSSSASALRAPLLGLLLGAALALPASQTGFAADLKMASGYPDNNYLTLNLREFLADVDSRTKGGVQVTLHNNQSLVKLPDILRAVQSNQVAFGEIYAANLGNQDPVFTLDAIPFVAPDEASAWKLWSASKPYVEQWFAKRGIRVLFAEFFPPQGFFTKKPVGTSADLAGLKLRIYSNETKRMGELLKAQPLVVQFGEVPQAFATGLIDAMFTSPQTGIDTQAWDFTKNFVNVGAMRAKLFVVVNDAEFKKLSPDRQRAVLAAAAEAEKRGMDRSTSVSKTQTDELKQRGIAVTEASPQLLGDLKGIGRTMVDEWAQRVTPEQRSVLERYRQAQGSDAKK